MRGFSLVAAALILCVATPAVAQEWEEFVSRDDRFTANFPGPPKITETTYKSQFGADLPARSRLSPTRGQHRPGEKIPPQKTKAGPAGAETRPGNSSPARPPGAGFLENQLGGAMIYATWEFMQRDAKVTELIWNNIDLVEGQLLHLTNSDKSRTYAGIFMHENKLYISEATVPPGAPEPGLFQQSLSFIDESGKTIRYQTLYHNGFPVPPRGR